MNFADEIERLMADPLQKGQQFNLRVSFKDWQKANVVIAGHTHLPVEEQLIAWARGRGWRCEMTRERDGVMITKTWDANGFSSGFAQASALPPS
jgi:hypothetical protein